MNIWNKVFLALIFLLAVVGVFFAGQEMKIQREWRKSIAVFEGTDKVKGKIAETEKKVEDLLAGSAPTKKIDEKTLSEMGLEELKAKLQMMVFERKKAWFGCQPGNVNATASEVPVLPLGGDKPETPKDKLRPIMLAEVKLTITEPKNDNGEVLPPDGLTGIVYLFEEGQAREGEPEHIRVGGSFLGRFTVKSVEKNQVTLLSANELNENEVEQIKKSTRSTWAVYLAVPTDRHDGIFDKMTPEELETLIPNKEIRKIFENPDRADPDKQQLQDFDLLLTAAYQRRVLLQLDMDTSNRQIAKLNESLAISNKEQDSLRQDIALAKKQVAEMDVQRKAVAEKLEELDATINDMKEKTEFEQKRNEWYVSKIAEYQLKVAELIDRKAEKAAMEIQQ